MSRAYRQTDVCDVCTGCRPDNISREEETREKKRRGQIFRSRHVHVEWRDTRLLALLSIACTHTRCKVTLAKKINKNKKSEPHVRDVSLTSGNTFLRRVIRGLKVRGGWDLIPKTDEEIASRHTEEGEVSLSLNSGTEPFKSHPT